MKASEINWDVPYGSRERDYLPKTVRIPERIEEDPSLKDSESLMDYISTWLTKTYGFRHKGFTLS